MKKTNLRINNFFILIHDNKHYLTDIDLLDDWKNTSPDELKKYIESNNCSDKINELIEKYSVTSNVNFTLSDFKKFKKSLEKAEVKVVSLKKGGSWQKTEESLELSGGSSKNSWQSGGDKKSMWQGGGAKLAKSSWQ